MPVRSAVVALAISAICVGTLPGCASTGGEGDSHSRTKKGALLGALAGAAAGAAIGGKDHRAGGVLIGAAAGALAGGLLGKYLDDQARELEAIPGAEVQRRDDSLLVNFSDAILFDTGKSTLMPGAYDRMRSLAATLNKYPQSQIIVKGHTDSVGAESFNQQLSEERAGRVRTFLISEGVEPSRITAIGFGESLPLVSNNTAAGRVQNRRVEIEIRPHDEVLQGS